MIEKDLEEYAQSAWSGLLEPVTSLSSSGAGKPSLVESDKKFYNFDKVMEQLLGKTGNKPCSGDGLVFSKKAAYFIEFKSGFTHKITKSNYDKEKMKCDVTGAECEPYRELFFKNQKTERGELLSSLRQKALEVYLVLEKKVLPCCEQTDPKRLVYVVVIDDDPTNAEEDILADVAGAATVKDNRLTDIRQSLQRLAHQTDAAGNTYCYDEIEVQTAAIFSRRLNGS